MNKFSSKNREAILHELANNQFDLLIIGGGVTGAGIALDATCRGLKVALVDMQDFAAGTSSRSTKLIHGGLRYLKQREFKLVAEVGKERAIVHRNAPHLAVPERMLLPIVKSGSLGRATARLGMKIYEWLADVKKTEAHQFLQKEETLLKEPLLNKEEVVGGILFYEYRTDDARLTIEILSEAVDRGAVAINYGKVVNFMFSENRENGESKIAGAVIDDQLKSHRFQINATYVVNAGGPWVDALDDLDKIKKPHKLQVTKGVHLVVDKKKLPVQQAIYFDTPDKRMIFVIPREEKIYIGTTDTFYEGDLQNPTVTVEDKTYLLNCVNAFFPGTELSVDDIESSWAGLRPLISKPGKGPSEISRRDEMFESETGLITIAGGKLTGYRKMAERVVDKVAVMFNSSAQKNIPVCTTDNVKLPGGKLQQQTLDQFVLSKTDDGIASGLTKSEARFLLQKYGATAETIFKIARNFDNSSAIKMPRLIYAQLIYAMENELCMTPSDFFIRRTGMLYFDIAQVIQWKDEVCKVVQAHLGFDHQTIEKHKQALDAAILACSL